MVTPNMLKCNSFATSIQPDTNCNYDNDDDNSNDSRYGNSHNRNNSDDHNKSNNNDNNHGEWSLIIFIMMRCRP